MKKPKNCPKCKSNKVLEIVYGYIEPKLVIEGKEEGEDDEDFYPGGCIIEDDSPAWYCDSCEYMWGIYTKEEETKSLAWIKLK